MLAEAVRLRVVIPAHNEDQVVRGVLSDLDQQASDLPDTRVVLLADRCTDNTVYVGHLFKSVEVFERSSGATGKAALLADYLAVEPLGERDYLVVLDADNRIPADFISRLSDLLQRSSDPVVQCYVDVRGETLKGAALASALSYWSGNRLVQLAYSRLGWSPDLAGTGMCISAEALEVVGGWSGSLTEDQDLALRLHLHDVGVTWVHDLKVFDEKPPSVRLAFRQRLRWNDGRRDTRAKYVGALTRRFVRTGDFESLEKILQLFRPSRSMILTFIGILSFFGVIPRRRRPRRRQHAAYAGLTTMHATLTVVALRMEGVSWSRIARIPLASLIAVLGVAVRLFPRRGRLEWSHTPHFGEGRGLEDS